MWRSFYLFVIAFSSCTVESTGQVQIGVLKRSAPIFRYSGEGECVWNSNYTAARGKELTLRGLENTELLFVTCEVENQLELDALVSIYDVIPSPTNVSLDDNVLQWSHVLQPPDLPPAFQLVLDFTLSYLVHMTDRDDVEAGRSEPTNETSFNIADMLDTCRTQNFTVQAVIDNEPLSENSSPVSGRLDCPTVPSPSTSEVISSSTSIVIDTISTSLPTPTESTTLSPNNNPRVSNAAIAVIIIVALLLACAVLVLTLAILYFRTRHNRVMHKKVHDHPSGDLKDNHTIERDHTVEGGHTAEDAIDGNTVGHEKEYHSVKDREYAQTAGYYPDGHGGSAAADDKPKLLNYPLVTLCPKTKKPPSLRVVEDSNTAYVSIDHVQTDKRCQERKACGAVEEESSTQQPAGEVSVDPHKVGLVPDLHLEPLLAVLAPVKAKWFQFGMALNLSENFLDETATNIETAEECLSDILKNWLQYHEPSMEALNYALSRINENPIAFNASQREFVFVSEGGRE